MNLRRVSHGILLVATIALAACGDLFAPNTVCTLQASPPPINVTIRDQAGNAEALGSVASFSNGTIQVDARSSFDSLVISGGTYSQTYDISVRKPFYQDLVLHNVRSGDGDRCGHPLGPVLTVQAALSLAAGAPPFRSLFLLPDRITLDRGRPGNNYSFTTVIDASPGVSRALRWRFTGDTASVGLDSVSGVLTYRCLKTSGYGTLTATSVVDSSVAASVAIAVQGHPAATSDPPCS